jgi:hypothetical protein
MVNPRQVIRRVVFALSISVFSLASVSLAYGQGDFSLTPSALKPPSVDPGGSSIATIDLEPTGGFNSMVTLSCVVVPADPAAVSVPTCQVSPETQTPPANGPSLTLMTTSAGSGETTSSGLYTITVTGTSGSITQTCTLTLNVVDITEDYSLSVTPTTATPSSVPAGNLATTIVTVTPIGSYGSGLGHQVTLACLSVTPIVTAAPYCSFSPATVAVTSGSPPTSTMTIITLGPTPTTRMWNHRIFYALWLAVPGLGLVGVGATGTRRKNAWGALLLLAVAGGILLLPACNTNNTNNPNGETTPNNTYTFTLTAADENGAVPANNTTTTTGSTAANAATVTLAVTSPN